MAPEIEVPRFRQLAEYIGQITSMCNYTITHARGLPADARRRVAAQIVEQVRSAVSALELKYATADRDARLLATAGHLNELRVLLPAMAAAAAIELGELMRELTAESHKGSTSQ
jgi:hypothetical protein